ncbi:hypothetical protein [Pseudomonas sp. KNUC1026]|uniref:hypothetical protein n=1 Tax=Pseudomonas sp. KNUC1026 TaxID=2893890 RepID=UPI001F163153|nr:hypothetical protein [Pseudomonas sp. KNUC1026]UFH50509.1 hypothetical protein LN139_04515 [Pseudomonas sp. KNUC1026]
MIGSLPERALEELATMAEVDGLALSDLAPVCETFDATPADVLNALSISVAQGYLDGSLTYEFRDDVMNGIINALCKVGEAADTPQPAFSLYQAFDLGEWRRKGDGPETDPGEKYSKPAVVEILRNLRSSSRMG